jgi:hypothetical protein
MIRQGRTVDPPHEHAKYGMMDQVTDTARDLGERAETMAEEVGTAIKERPYTSFAIAAGLAFAIGALWKLGHVRPQSRLDSLLAKMPDLPSREQLQRRWR